MLVLDSVEGPERHSASFAEGQEGAAWFSEPPSKELGYIIVPIAEDFMIRVQ